MPSLRFRRNLLIILFVLSIILLVSYIILISDSKTTDSENKIVDAQEISQRFINTLYEFGIDEELIKESKSHQKFSNGPIPFIKVQVPKDLSIPELLLGIKQTFAKDSLQIKSSEIKKEGKSVLELKYKKSAILHAELDYSKKVFRDRGSIGFIIKDTDLVDLSNNNLVQLSIKLNFLIRPGLEALQNLNVLRENGKQYSILIDDEINEQKYTLSSEHSKTRVVTVLKTLITDFSSSVCFVIDDKSEFYKSSNYELFSAELKKREIKAYSTSDFTNLASEESPVNNFESKIHDLKSNEGKIFLLDEETFRTIQPNIEKFQKMGFRVVNTSLLFGQTKTNL